jgi:hypothetical protein
MKAGDTIRMTQSVAGANFELHAEQEVTVGRDCSPEEARNWLACGAAEPAGKRAAERAESTRNRR